METGGQVRERGELASRHPEQGMLVSGAALTSHQGWLRMDLGLHSTFSVMGLLQFRPLKGCSQVLLCSHCPSAKPNTVPLPLCSGSIALTGPDPDASHCRRHRYALFRLQPPSQVVLGGGEAVESQ